MDQQSSVMPVPAYREEEMSFINYCSFLLPTDIYSTRLANFPGTNCVWRWAPRGHFFMSMTFIERGKEIGRQHSNLQDQEGFFDLNLDDFTSFFASPMDGLIITTLHHPKKVPPDLYTSHIHKKTGAYLAYPPSGYVGEKIYTTTHATELENTIFWPGIVNNETVETSLVALNPYKTPFSMQIGLFCRDRHIQHSKVIKVSAWSKKILTVDELFPENLEAIKESRGDYSLCISAQYKIIAYVMIRHRETGVVTTIDHLHRFCLY